MPVLARMVATPLIVDVRRGALDDLCEVLADQRISTQGRLAVVTSRSAHERLRDRLCDQLTRASWFVTDGGTIDDATGLADQVRKESFDAIVGIGGGRVIDVTKFTAARVGLPVVAVATNLAHDGIASPVSILDNDAGRGSYGVPAPVAVLVDLDEVRLAPPRYVRAGIGDVLSNLSALADWQLSHQRTGEPVDGLAVTLARSAADSLLHHPGGIESDDFLVTLAESLVLSGLAMIVAGTSRPCSGACHEISHALDLLRPTMRGAHGEQVALGAAFATHLRDDPAAAGRLVSVLRRHHLPVLPEHLGLDDALFVESVLLAPSTRPGRFTVLEQLDLSAGEVADALQDYRRLVADIDPTEPGASLQPLPAEEPIDDAL